MTCFGYTRYTILYFVTAWTLLYKGECSCVIESWITHQDEGINITSTTNPCELILQTTTGQQVVAAFYDLKADCAGPSQKGNIIIYDGIGSSKTEIINSCVYFGRDVSYASRKNGLTIRLLPVYKPFKFQLYLLDDVTLYTTPTGTIRSQRYRGYVSSAYTETSPNNLHAFYSIVSDESVSITLHFKELLIRRRIGGICEDFLRIPKIDPSGKFCGDHFDNLPGNETVITNELSLEFRTDATNTYAGFEVMYTACFAKKQDSNRTETFLFPMFSLADKTRCAYDIQLEERRKIVINMTVSSHLQGRGCKDIIKIIVDGNDVTNISLEDCSMNTETAFVLTVAKRLRFIFTSEGNTEFVKGIYKTDAPGEEPNFSTTQGQPTPLYNESSGSSENISKQATSSKYDLEPIIAPVVVLSVLAIVVTLLAVLYRRGVIPKKFKCNTDSTYEDPLHHIPENQYAVPSSGMSQRSDNPAYQNETFGSQSSPDQNYYNVVGQKIPETLPGAGNQTSEQQYEDHLVQSSAENEHQYIELKPT